MTGEALAWAYGDGPATGEMAEAALLLEMKWSWQEYLDAPDALVQMMFLLLNARAEATKESMRLTRE